MTIEDDVPALWHTAAISWAVRTNAPELNITVASMDDSLADDITLAPMLVPATQSKSEDVSSDANLIRAIGGERQGAGEKGDAEGETTFVASTGYELPLEWWDQTEADGSNVISPSSKTSGALVPSPDTVYEGRAVRGNGVLLDERTTAGILYADIDSEATIKAVKKREKPRQDPRLGVLGGELEREMHAAQFGWSRMPCLDPHYLPLRSFAIEALDLLPRKISEASVETLCQKARTEKQGLRSQMSEHALDIVVDRTLVDPTSFTFTHTTATPMLRPLLTSNAGAVPAYLLAGWQRHTALRRLWLQPVDAEDEASIEWTTETCRLLAERGTWSARLWDKRYLETSVYGPAIIQLLRDNGLPSHRGDSAARKTATLAASIDNVNVETIQAVMLVSLHTGVEAESSYSRVMGRMPAIRNLLVDFAQDPAYVSTGEMVEQIFDPAGWEVIGDWGEIVGEFCATPKGWARILSHASRTNPFYSDRLSPANAASVAGHTMAFHQLYSQHVPSYDLLHYRMLSHERALYNLLTAASEAALQEVPQILDFFREMALRGILTGWRDYPKTVPQALWTEYYTVLAQTFDCALDAHNDAGCTPPVQSPNLIKNAVYNITNSKLDPDENGLGPLRWSTRLPLPCPSIMTVLMDVFAHNARIDNASTTLNFIVNALAPGSLRIRDETRPKDDIFDQARFTAVGLVKSWVYAMCERRYSGNQKSLSEEKIADLVLAYQKIIDSKTNKSFERPIRSDSALDSALSHEDEREGDGRRRAHHIGKEVAEERSKAAGAGATVTSKQALRENSVLIAHLKFITDSWANHAYLHNSISGVVCYPSFTSDMRKEYMQALDDLPSASDSQNEIVIRAARLLPHFPVDPFVPLQGTASFVDFNSRDDVMVPAAIQYAVYAGDVVSTIAENPSVKNMHDRIVEMLTEEDLLGEAWTSWSGDLQIVSSLRLPQPPAILAHPTSAQASVSTGDSSIRAIYKADRLKAAEAVPISLVQEMVDRGGRALQEYQEGNCVGEYTLSKKMIAALRGVIKQLFVDVYEVHGGTDYTTQEVINAKIEEVEERFMSQIKALTPQQLADIKEKVEGLVAEGRLGADRMDVPTEGEQGEEKGALEVAQSINGKRKTTPDEDEVVKRLRLDGMQKGGR
ncbi:hypothetical protein EV122DRAFT_283738 [Schizophyllum commune]